MNVERPSAKRTSMNPPPPMLPARRMRHGQRESHRNRRIHRVAARFQHLDADVGRERLLRHHHGVPGAHRLARA